MNIDDVTYQIRGVIFEVNKVLGYGFLEKVYEKALMIELSGRGVSVENQVPLKVSYKEQIVGEYFADLLVEGRVIAEIKSVANLLREHQPQLLNYLKATGICVGLLVNFTRNKAEIRRMVLDLPEGQRQ
jgi:GxxExxY protein